MKYFLLLVYWSWGVPAQAQNNSPLFEELYTIDSLSLTLEGDVHQMQRVRNPDLWLPAQLHITKGKKHLRSVAVEMQARGKARRKICYFPPVKIRLAGEQLPDSLQSSRNIKLVAACQREQESEDLVLKEYLMYRLYNVVDEEASFRVKLVNLDFKQSGRRAVFHSSVAFLLENENAVGQRLRARPHNARVTSPRAIDSVSLERVCLFQYMIGNTDWSIYNQHNVKVFMQRESRRLVAVPYDFDYAGAVAAPYAMPSKGLPLRDVKQRYYLGLCRPEAFKQQMIHTFLVKKNAILHECTQTEGLAASGQALIVSYLKAFFETLEDPEAVRKEILEHCDNFKSKK